MPPVLTSRIRHGMSVLLHFDDVFTMLTVIAGKELVLTMTNVTSGNVAFKVKTTAPDRYLVKYTCCTCVIIAYSACN